MPFTFNASTVPFSRYGSYMALVHDREHKYLSLRALHGETMSGGTPLRRQAFAIELRTGGRKTAFTSSATPWELVLRSAKGTARFCFSSPDTVRFTARGVSVRLSMDSSYNALVVPDDANWVVNSNGNKRQFYLRSYAGTIRMDAPWKGTVGGSKSWVDYTCGDVTIDFLPENGKAVTEGSIEMFKGSWSGKADSRIYSACVKAVKEEFAAWQKGIPAAVSKYPRGMRTASYIDWSCVVAPDGNFGRPAMFMSKNWMNGVWSWDHAFNAMGTLAHNPRLAWDQLMLMFDVQDDKGGLPDIVTDTSILWNFTKPPVHGWALGWMMERNRFINKKRLTEIYGPLCKWTDWWFRYRDADRDGLPGYNHGNDSGWDNATLFMAGPPLTSPDLASFLILQMDVLAKIAIRLGKKREAGRWTKRGNRLYKLMIKKLWDGERFIALSPRGKTPAEADSLISFMPLVLGKRLNGDIRKKLVAGLTEKGRFMCPAGLASEALTSPYHRQDCYWQGPAWPASTMLIVDGLVRAGEAQLARKIARKFCRNADKHGMAENHHAVTGIGLCDKAYTWTSSVFMVLAAEYV